jgi:type I restriction enzyme, S subunit
MLQINSIQDGDFKETEAGLIPADWHVCRLGSLARLHLGRTPSRNNHSFWESDDHPWVAISDLDNGHVSVTAEGISDKAFSEVFRATYVPSGTLLMSFKLTIGRIGILDMPALHNEAIVSFLDLDESVDRDFLGFLLRFTDFDITIDTYLKGKTLNKGKLEVFPIPLPPLPEQRRISAVLNTIQDEIAAQDNIITEAREFKRSLMQRLFTYGAGTEPAETKETKIGEVPAHWEVATLSSIARIERGKFTHRPRNDPAYYGGSVPFIQTGDVSKANGRITTYTQTLSELGLSVSRIFPAGTIVLTIAANIADCGIIEFDSAFPDSLVGITPKIGIDAKFLNYYLQTQKRRMDELAPKGTQKNINIQFLEPYPAVKPPFEEQCKIAEQLAVADEKLAAEQDRKAAMQDFFNTMLHQLMTGQIRLPSDDGLPL